MNKRLASQPVVIVTGAGASKWLGKATTFDIYDSPEFQQRTQLNLLIELRNHVIKFESVPVVDLEHLLDYLKEFNSKFDELKAFPQYTGHMNNLQQMRKNLENVYEETLDFMIDYYAAVQGEKAAALYEPFFDNLAAIPSRASRKDAAISLFTLNYDEAIEYALNELSGRYRLVDGFVGVHPPVWKRQTFEDVAPLQSTVPVVLFKLHGSVSWTRPVGTNRIEKTVGAPRRRPGKEHVVLYPTKAPKEVGSDPFATAYEYLDAALTRCRAGVFIGTSFRDAELRDIIQRRLRTAQPFELVSMNPEADKQQIAELLDYPVRHIVPIPRGFAPENITELCSNINEVLTSSEGVNE